MFNLKDTEFTLNCKQCNKEIPFTIDQVQNEALIICSCGEEIQLIDGSGNLKQKISKAQRSLDKLDKTFKSLGD